MGHTHTQRERERDSERDGDIHRYKELTRTFRDSF